jgi:hypothetical protein
MERPRLLARLRNAIRVRNLSTSTERAYVHWVRRYILFHRKRHPSELEENDVRRFLTHLAVEWRVAASTQNQALCAVLFLYKHVLDAPLGWVEQFERARRPSGQTPSATNRWKVEHGESTTRRVRPCFIGLWMISAGAPRTEHVGRNSEAYCAACLAWVARAPAP